MISCLFQTLNANQIVNGVKTTMKDKELVERRFLAEAGKRAPEKMYEVYDEVDTNHCILIYRGTSKTDAIAKAKEYAKKHDIPLGCMGAYELTKQEEATHNE